MLHRRALILGTAAIAVAAAGCGRQDAAPAAPGGTPGGGAAVNTSAALSGTLEVWAMGAEGDSLKTLTDKFVAANPGVKINVTPIPWGSAYQKFVTAVSANQVPDVAQVGSTWMAEFKNAFDPVPGSIDKAKFFEGAQKTNEVGGVAVGVPWYVETRVVFYNKAVATKAGITAEPKNWDEFMAMVKAMKEKGGATHGISILPGGDGSWQTVLPLMWSNGGKITSDDLKKWSFDDPKNVEALKYYQDFFTQGLANKAPVGDTLVADFASGKVPMFISGPWMMSAVEKDGKMGKDAYGVFVMPKKESAASFIGGANLVVFRATKNRDAAWRLVDYLTTKETQLDFYKTVSAMPSIQAAWDDAAMKTDPKLAVFGEQLKTAFAPPAVATWEQVAKQFDAQVEKVTKTGTDPAAALKELQSQATTIGLG